MLMLDKVSVKEVKYKNKIAQKGEIRLDSTIDYTFKANEENKAVGVLRFKASDNLASDNIEDVQFLLEVEMQGLFSLENEKASAELSDQSVQVLHPHLCSYVSALTALSGSQALFLPPLLEEDGHSVEKV